MSDTTYPPQSVAAWLDYIESLHPKSIEMGLERIETVAKRLQIVPSFPIISVAGTNGKGSTTAILAQVYTSAGYRVATYTSPHFIHYNERIRINHQSIEDKALCEAFAIVDEARDGIPLTYFEVGTLAAMWYFAHSDVDIAILEVGMGGRLDAVNAFDSDCAIVTSIDIDHTAFLGDTREAIGFEKAGIYRTNKPAICGDENPPKSLVEHAESIQANCALIQRDFYVKKITSGWQYSDEKISITLPKLSLEGDFQLNNAACALRAVFALNQQLPVTDAQLCAAMQNLQLLGRFYQWSENPKIILDVAHNPQAAKSLAHNLYQHACSGKTLGVVAMLADKDIKNVLSELVPNLSSWYIADSNHERGAQADILKQQLMSAVNAESITCFNTVSKALEAAYIDCAKNDRIIVFGSFYTVADAIKVLQSKGN